MALARKQENLDDAHWISLPTAAAMLGESRLRVLTRVVKGELIAKHVAGRTIVSRESLKRLLDAQ